MAPRARGPAEELAALCAAAWAEMARGGRTLHDEAGPLLSGAGFKLALMRADHRAVDRELGEVVDLLDQAMEHVRQVSQQLNPSPVARTGLKQALMALAEAEPTVKLGYTASARVPPQLGPILYETAVVAVRAALRARASRIKVVVTGTAGLRLRITDNGRGAGRPRALAAAVLLAGAVGISVDIATKKDTIVAIRYDMRRITGR